MIWGVYLIKKLTEKQRNVFLEGIKGEMKVEKWLRDRGFRIIESHEGKSCAGYYDIKARKGKDKWIMEVKKGENPKINIANFEKMLNEKGFNRIGLALVTDHNIHLLEYKKMTFAGLKATKTKRRKKAAKKAWETRKLESSHEDY
jgi:hypothetical protein